MTMPLSGLRVAERLRQALPEAVAEASETAVVVNADSLLEAAGLLKATPDVALDYLVSITGVDYYDYFEVVYHLASITHNHSLVLKARCFGRENPIVPSVTSLWRGADLQEREVYDLMGIAFAGHPNLKRVLLWDSFEGHPLRRDNLGGPKTLPRIVASWKVGPEWVQRLAEGLPQEAALNPGPQGPGPNSGEGDGH